MVGKSMHVAATRTTIWLQHCKIKKLEQHCNSMSLAPLEMLHRRVRELERHKSDTTKKMISSHTQKGRISHMHNRFQRLQIGVVVVVLLVALIRVAEKMVIVSMVIL